MIQQDHHYLPSSDLVASPLILLSWGFVLLLHLICSSSSSSSWSSSLGFYTTVRWFVAKVVKERELWLEWRWEEDTTRWWYPPPLPCNRRIIVCYWTVTFSSIEGKKVPPLLISCWFLLIPPDSSWSWTLSLLSRIHNWFHLSLFSLPSLFQC